MSYTDTILKPGYAGARPDIYVKDITADDVKAVTITVDNMKLDPTAMSAGTAAKLLAITDDGEMTTTDIPVLSSPGGDGYTKTEVDSLLVDKADVDDVYTKVQVDTLLADIDGGGGDGYTKTEVDTLLIDKADADDVYTKTQVNLLIADIGAGGDGVYSKGEVDNLLVYKVDADDVYTRVEIG